MVTQIDWGNLAPSLNKEQKHTQHHIEIERQIIHLMLNNPKCVKELLGNGFTADYFSADHRPLVDAIIQEHKSSDGTRLVTRDGYHHYLLKSGLKKGDAYVYVQLHDKCHVGTNADINDMSFLLESLREGFYARKCRRYLADFADNYPKVGYQKAMTNLSEQIQNIIDLDADATGSRMPQPIYLEDIEIDDNAQQSVWQGIIVKGCLTLLAGRPKTGKSTLVYNVLRLLKTGGRMHQQVFPGKALYISEDPILLWQERQELLGISDQTIMYMDGVALPKANWTEYEQSLRHVRQVIVNKNIDVVVFDTVSKLMPIESNNEYQAVVKSLEMIRKTLRDTNVAILCLHHLGKSKTVLGSTAFEGEPDLLVMMDVDSTDEYARKLEFSGRFGPGFREMWLRYNSNTGEYAELPDCGDELADNHVLDQIEAILSATPQSFAELYEQLPHTSRATIQRHLKKGTELGRWDRTGNGKKSDPFRYTKPKDEVDGSQRETNEIKL